MGKEVLLIDLDPQANLTLGLGVTPGSIRRSIADVLLNSASLLSVSRESGVEGIDLVPSNHDMSLAERFLPVRQDFEHILANALRGVDRYDFILIDCPPSLGSITLNALTAAQFVICPTQPEYFSAYGLRSIMATIRKVRTQTNPNLTYLILITMFDRRNRIHRSLGEQLRATFDNGLLSTMIEVDTKLRESSVAGLPITHYFAKSRSAVQYTSLAQEIIDYVQEPTAQPN